MEPSAAPVAAPPPAVALPGAPEGQGYWRLVWGQFRKNRLALVSTWIIVLLFLIAAWAPVLANGLPWVWTENGKTSYPLCRYLVAPTAKWSVDYLFNYFLFLSLAAPLVLVAVGWLGRRARLPRRKRERRLAWAVLGAAALAGVPFIGPGSWERTATLSEREREPERTKVTEYHFLRRWVFETRDYLNERRELDPARGDRAVFTLVAQDPVTPTPKVLAPPGSYAWHLGEYWRVSDPDALRARDDKGAAQICLQDAVLGAWNTPHLLLWGHAGRIVCYDPDVQRKVAELQPGTPLWLCGTLRLIRDERGQVKKGEGGVPVGLELLLQDIQPRPFHPEITWHMLGTDSQGRDVLARMIHGARISMSVGFVSVAIAVLLGIFIGGLAGYYRGWVDIVVSRLIELMICFPTFFLILTLVAIIEERSIFDIMLIIGLTGWTGVARLVRGEFLKLVGQDFVHAARALGCDGRRVMFRHILPNALGPVLVSAAFGVAGAVLTESGLAYLGFGAPPPTPTWGEMISQGKDNMDVAWWLMLYPGLSIFLTVTVYNLAGDGLRDAMDPRLRK